MAIISVTDTGRTLKYRVTTTVATTTIDPLVDAPNLAEPLRSLMSQAMASDAAAGSLLGVPPAAGGIEDNRIRCTMLQVAPFAGTHAGMTIAGARKAVTFVPTMTIASTTAAGPDLIIAFEANPLETGPGLQIVT